MDLHVPVAGSLGCSMPAQFQQPSVFPSFIPTSRCSLAPWRQGREVTQLPLALQLQPGPGASTGSSKSCYPGASPWCMPPISLQGIPASVQRTPQICHPLLRAARDTLSSDRSRQAGLVSFGC